MPTRYAISIAVCDALGWHRPDGRRKDMSARVALWRMEADGLISLPPPRHANSNGRAPRRVSMSGQLPLVPCGASLSELAPIEIEVVRTKASSKAWRSLIAAHHYLGYVPFAGAQLRYLVQSAHGTLGALGFASFPWS